MSDNRNNYYSQQDIERRRRRKAEIRKKRIRRMIIVLAMLLVIAILLITLLVMGIRAIVRHIKAKNDTAVTNAVTITEEYDKAFLESPSPSPSPKPDYLGYNPTVAAGSPSVNGISLYEGYKVTGRDKAYYITSENVQSSYGILINASTGEAICQKDGFVRIAPASMTKILTVLVAAEHLTEDDLSKTVTITNEDTYYSYKNDLSAVGFSDGEVVTVEDLFYGTILPSGADAASALMKYVAGDMDTFIDMMNEKIEELGLKDTHFTNGVGLYNDNHYTTCADMAMILKATIENEYCFKVMNAHKYTTSTTQEHPEGIEISNWFLRRIEDKETGGEVLCAKTGYVHESGSCAASLALQDDGTPYICVTGNAHSAWRCIYDQVDIYLNCTGLG